MEALEKVTKEDILKSTQEIDEKGYAARYESVKYDLLINNKRYPIKYVLSLATKYAFGEDKQIPSQRFFPAETIKILKNLGFEVVLKENIRQSQKIWWVNQGDSYERAKEGGYIWAPLRKKDGKDPLYHWEMLSELQIGDIVLNYANGYIRSISTVAMPAINAPRPSPSKDGKWAEEGRLVKLEYHLLEPPIKLDKFNKDILDLNINQGPINSAGRVNQGYLYRFSIDGLKIIQECQQETKWPDFTNFDRSWVFQANPKLYDLRSAINQIDELNWKVSSYKDEIRLGDRVYFWESGPNASIVAIGEIIREPSILPKDDKEIPFIIDPEIDNDTYPRARVRIIYVLDNPLTKNELLDNPLLANMQIIRAPMGSNFKLTREEDAELRRLIPNEAPPMPHLSPKYTIEDLTKDTGFSIEIIESWNRRLLRKKHIIFQGPPGTGKTFVAQKLAKLIISETKGFYDLVQFHPSYAYEDFIQGIRPSLTDGGQISYDLEDGRFVQFCKRAAEISDSPCILIIDEINRANISRVFGELMYLLEYRDSEIPLSCGIKFKVPDNVYIIGTMNTADRSIAVVDHALRRRFSFIRLSPEYDVLKKFLISKGYPGESLVRVLSKINTAIDDPNYEMGISYFMKRDDNLRANLPEIWESEIESYLEEYFYDKPSMVNSFRWKSLSKGELIDWLS